MGFREGAGKENRLTTTIKSKDDSYFTSRPSSVGPGENSHQVTVGVVFLESARLCSGMKVERTFRGEVQI